MKEQYAIRMIANAIYINGRRSGSSWNAAACTPSAVTLSVISDTQINGSFTINGTGQDGHKVYISTDGVTYTLLETLTGADNTFEATGLTAGTLYYFYVTAYKGVTESPASNVASVVPYKILYVRPLGGSYGSEDGSTYDNAFSGFVDIAWASVTPGTVLYVCGTHNEQFNTGASGTSDLHIQVRGDYPGDPGVIDGQDTIAGLMNSNSQTYIEYHYMTVCNGVTTCVNNNASAYLWHYNGHYYDSTDQVTEQNSNVIVVYEDCEISGGGDDGLSMHTGSSVTLRRCYVHDNDQNIQSSGGTALHAYDTRFSNGGSANVSLDFNGAVLERCKFDGAVGVFVSGSISYSLFDLRGLLGSSSFLSCPSGLTGLTVDNCTLVGKGLGLTVGSSPLVFRNTIIYDIALINNTSVTLDNCNVCGLSLLIVSSNTNEVLGLPGFTDYNAGDFTLIPESPLLDKGINLGYTIDIDGNLVPSTGIALGCYQKASASVVNPSVDYFDILAQGTGAVLSEIRLKSNAIQTITLTGNAKFYTDSGGTTGESGTWDISANTLETRYIKLASGIERLWLDKSKIIAIGGTTANNYGFKTVLNSPRVYCDLSNFNSAIEVIWVVGTGNYTFNSISSYTSLIRIAIQDGRHVETGDITNFTSLTWLVNIGYLSGDIGSANMVNGLDVLILARCAMTTYTSGAVWSNCNVSIEPAIGYGYSQTEVGNIIIDMNNSASGPASRAIKLTGANASMADTNQGGIWGTFSGETTPSTLATAYKNMVRVKSNTLTLNGITVPGGSGDGTGFPAGFGDWYRS